MIYFDNAASSGHKPDCVIQAVADSLRHLSANPGRSGHNLAIKAAMNVEKARSTASQLFGLTEQGNVIFTYNCTHALNYAILGHRGFGHVITTALEHNSVLRPLYHLEREGRIHLTVVYPREDGLIYCEDIVNKATKNTVMVACTHISNVTGAVSPIDEIGDFCHARNITFLVDAAQSAGHLDIDMSSTKINLLAVAGHKGLHAPQGIGLLLTDNTTPLSPIIMGGTGTDSLRTIQPTALPEALESGTVATPNIDGLNAAMLWIAPQITANASRVHEISHEIYNALYKIDNLVMYTPRKCISSGIITFNITASTSATVSNILNQKFDIATRSGLHCAPLAHKYLRTLQTGAVRISVSAFNSDQEVSALIDSVTQTADRL